MLKGWYPDFNPLLENFTKTSLWMLLPNFPIEFWSVRIFEAVANSVGKFIFFDEQSLHWNTKRLAWVLVELDLDRGLLDIIDLAIGDSHLFQAVDFWKEPFRCHSCWQTCHLKSKCLLSREHTQSTGQTLSYFEQDEGIGLGPFDSGSFLGKMHFFFPSFFNKLSSDKLDYLKCNERWVLDIFRDFRNLLMKKVDKSDVSHDLRSA
jgi:hypothetical protein